MLGLDVAQVGHDAVVQPKDVALEADIGPRPKHTGEELQPHLHLVVQTDTFNLNLCTIRIEIGAMPSCNHCSGTPRAAPSLSYS